MTGAWKIEIVRVRLARTPSNVKKGDVLQPFLRVVLGVTECELKVPVELPDGRGTYYPPRVPPSISGDHVYKTPGNPLMTGLFLPMRGTKDLFRIQLMNRGGDSKFSELGVFTIDVGDVLDSAYFAPQGCVGEFMFHESWPCSDGVEEAVGSCVMRLKYTLNQNLALSFREKPTYVLDDRPVERRVSEDEDTLPVFSGIPPPRERSSSGSGGAIPMFRGLPRTQ